MSFALDFDRDSEVSLAITANLLRVVDDAGVRVRDVPRLAGVSKEAIAMALGFLSKRGYATVAASVITLTPKGRSARDAYPAVVSRWEARELRESLETLVGDLDRGLVPYPESWRAKVPKPETLPHYPLVLHRGGYPDGS